jgi:hypothetical protein
LTLNGRLEKRTFVGRHGHAPSRAIHQPLEIARDTLPSGEMLMKALALVVAVALALGASGCVSKQEPISDAKVGDGIAPKTRLIMARLQ